MRRTTSPGLAISGDMLKYGFVGGCIALGYVFQGKEEPRFQLTEGAVDLDPATLKPIGGEDGEKLTWTGINSPAPPAATVADAAAFTDDAPVSLDDSALFGALQARMQSLADGPDETSDESVANDEPAPSVDSADSWGTGDTAVLERPESGNDAPRDVFDGDTKVEFPTGFPLRDGEVLEMDSAPAASADQVAMLNRMFGVSADDASE